MSPVTLAKVHSFCPCLQYTLTPLEPISEILPPPSNLMNRLYEDWHESGPEQVFQDPTEARHETEVSHLYNNAFMFYLVPVDSTAYVRFKLAESAKKCIESENGATWMGRIIKCEKCWNFLGRNTPPISLESTEKQL